MYVGTRTCTSIRLIEKFERKSENKAYQRGSPIIPTRKIAFHKRYFRHAVSSFMDYNNDIRSNCLNLIPPLSLESRRATTNAKAIYTGTRDRISTWLSSFQSRVEVKITHAERMTRRQ